MIATTSQDTLLKLLPAPRAGGFAMDGYWVWCGSVVQGEDGRFHMFAARWPKRTPFFSGYPIYSEIVRAVADQPEGPYAFVEVVLPVRGEEFWDGRMTHNPFILKADGRYYLYYIGSTFTGPYPPLSAFENQQSPPQTSESWLNIRLGVATADAVSGPWTRLQEPVLEPRPEHWDALITTNPAPCLLPDGSVYLYYRSSRHGGKAMIGVAAAAHPAGPFDRVHDKPLLDFPDSRECVEDPFVWHDGKRFRMIAKDLEGGLTGEYHAGTSFVSENGIEWALAAPVKAYSRSVLWDDGQVTVQGCLERPFLLFQDGQPSYLFAATGDGPGGFVNAENTWNMVIPLQR